MNADLQLKKTLHMVVKNAVTRMELLKDPSDRRCLFKEYREWLGDEIKDDVWAIPVEVIQNEIDT